MAALSNSQVVILAAGVGSRLRPLTLKKPKPLIHVGGQAIIDRQINSFLGCGVKRFTVVIGYRAIDVIKHLSKNFPYPSCSIDYLYNPYFAKTNTVYSLWLASSKLEEYTTVVANGDLILTSKSIGKLMSCPDSCLAVGKHPCGKEEVKVELNGDLIINIGKGLDPRKVQGEYLGLAKFKKEFGQVYRKALDEAITMGKINLYYDDVIQTLLPQQKVRSVDLTDDKLIEIDSLEDYQNAEKLLA